MRIRLASNASPRARQAGLSLVELMVAIALGLFMLAGLGVVFTQTSTARSELDRALQQVENARYSAQVLADDLRHAGYFGRYRTDYTAPATLPSPCAADLPTLQAAMAVPLQAYDSPATVPADLAGCLNAADFVPNTDIVVVRRVLTTSGVSVASAAPGVVYLQSTAYPNGPAFVLGTAADTSVFTLQEKKSDGSGTIVAASLFPYVVRVYFVSPCDIPAAGTSCTGAADDGGRPIPTLKRLELRTDATGTLQMTKVALVEGIENLQVDYGVDAATAGSTGDGAPDTYTTAPGVADWLNVVSVQLHLLARNTERTLGSTDTKTYNLGLVGNVGPFNDAYKRHAAALTVRVNNVSGPRGN